MSKNITSSHVVKFLFGQYKESPAGCFVMALTQVLFVILSSIIAPIFISKLLTNITGGSATLENSSWLLLGYAITLFFGTVVMYRLTIALAYKIEVKMQSKVEAKVFKHLCNKSLDFHSNKMSGGLVSDNSKLNGALERFWDTVIFSVVPITTTIIATCIALSFILWQFAVILCILSVVIILIIIKTQIKIAPISAEHAKKSSALTARVADSIGNIATVKAFAQEKTELKKFKGLLREWRDATFKEMKSVLFVTGTFSFLMAFMNVCAFAAAILAVQYKLANVGSIYLIISYTMSIVSQLWSVSGATRNYVRIIGDATPMIQILNEPIEITDTKNPLKSSIQEGAIDFKNVSFTHKDKNEPLFDNFSLSIKPGEQVGLVGKSGSGKTSLTRILLRFSDINSGKIIIDGQDITKITQADLRRAISYVPQDPVLFHRSLRENIAFGKQDASDKEILFVAKQAHALDFIQDLPGGLDSMVGERGIKLSGGQRQRIAIARALLKDAPILILDEATSALDSENEQLIQDAVWKLIKGRTSIVIAHRLSTIAKLDRIIVLDNGKVVEQGKHKDLLEKGGIYAKLWKHQSGGFIKD